ncbi:MAG: 16S rRNA (adenine(1518)-N(6)/adenine(1519)-N(6))-dimethyltransferase RsmA [Pirellulales bacterium]
MTAPRQTASYLMRRFEEVGIQPVTRHGQNFLIDLNLVDLLVHTADLGPDDVVLEVGTGTGSLTGLMAQQAGAVVTVELDAQLHQLASEALVEYRNVVMLQQDALKNKNRFHTRVLEAVKEQLDAAPGRRLKLVANLPYNIATPVLSNLLTVDPLPVAMVATIQKEVAERIAATPRTKDYSALSVWMQAQCDIEIVRVMPPTVFWPRPKVDSAIIRIEPNVEKRARIPDLEYFHQFARAMFFHRRKFLRSELLSAFKGQIDKPTVDAVLAEMEFSPQTRAEELDVETLQRLCEVVRSRGFRFEE